MFRSLFRLPAGFRSGGPRLGYCLTSCGQTPTFSTEENATTKKSVSSKSESNRQSFDFSSAKRTTPERVDHRSNDGRKLFDMSKSLELESFLSSIASKVAQLSCDELEAAHKKLFDLYHQSSGRSGPKHYRTVQNLVESPIYDRLLDETNRKIGQFSASQVVTVFQSVASFEYDKSQSRTVQKTMQALRGQLKELDLEQLFTCLSSANYNMRDLKLLRGAKKVVNIFEFSQAVMKETRHRILANTFDSKEAIEMVVKNFHIFLRPLQFDEKVISHLTQALLRPQFELSLQQSVVLLSKIKKCYLMHTQVQAKLVGSDLMQNKEFVAMQRERLTKWQANEYLPKEVAKLIDKCNQKIYASCDAQPNRKDQHFYLAVLHDVVNPVNYEFNNLYDPKLLHDFLAPFFLEHNSTDSRINSYLSNLAFNYYTFHWCDERLLRLLYDSISRQPADWRKLHGISHIYFVFTKYRLPFVDANRLATAILDPSDAGFQQVLNYKMTSITLLVDLVLNNVTNERLYDYLDRRIEKLKGNIRVYGALKKRLFAKLTLARVHLSIFDGLKDSVKQRILDRIDSVLANAAIANRQPKVNNVFQAINTSLQANGYLSNGLYLDTFGIYDKSTGELVSLSGHDFNKIDEIPLTNDQQLFAILLTEHLKGREERFENAYILRMAEILNRLKIKVIKLEDKVIENLSIEDRVNFFIQTALDSYK